ncbi:uncharacterized protein LOC110710009 isoform X2 [Chenopodium quinoa]|uniref:uncharacterized protein LOC110710009 isoform X2 n=1 Tax=Chenopodium quinoa TaxID=63459 RepID=UPI000B774D34|nr:uncharacterized protein LOC110710009 isoform X2 [Chenopodium quinoa]
MTDIPEALRLSAHRIILVGTGRFVWYLGERVVHQHSGDRFVVPSSPPESMLYSRLIRELINRRERYTFPWQELVHMESNYARDLIPSLAPPPRLPEFQTTIRPVGRIKIPPQSVRYPGSIGITEDHVADAPEGYRQAQESLPEVFELVSFLRCIIHLFNTACY